MGGRGSNSRGGGSVFTHEDHMAAIRAWSNTEEYKSIRSGDPISARNRAALEDYISKNPGVDRNLMRGVSLSDADLASIREGENIDMRGISGWSTRKGIAQSFARENVSSSNPNQVVFTLRGGSQRTAKVPGKSAGGSRYSEGEVLMSGSVKLRVVSKKWSSWGRTEVVVEEVP